METEFPQLREKQYQKDFLADWYTPMKVFVGPRRSGKTELILSELRRFERNQLSSLLIAPSRQHLFILDEMYRDRFGESIKCDSANINRIDFQRGKRFDCILFDDIHEVSYDWIEQSIMRFDPTFFHATADKASFNPEGKRAGLFDSVYTTE